MATRYPVLPWGIGGDPAGTGWPSETVAGDAAVSRAFLVVLILAL
ncbi:hypothetical protein [Nocardia sp. NPDC019395]